MEKKISFEEKVEMLDRVIEKIENGKTPLEETMKLYNEGLTLITELDQMLRDAEFKITTIVDKNPKGK